MGSFEAEILQAIEKARGVVKESIKAKQVQTSSVNVADTPTPSLIQPSLNVTESNTMGTFRQRLEPLSVSW